MWLIIYLAINYSNQRTTSLKKKNQVLHKANKLNTKLNAQTISIKDLKNPKVEAFLNNKFLQNRTNFPKDATLVNQDHSSPQATLQEFQTPSPPPPPPIHTKLTKLYGKGYQKDPIQAQEHTNQINEAKIVENGDENGGIEELRSWGVL